MLRLSFAKTSSKKLYLYPKTALQTPIHSNHTHSVHIKFKYTLDKLLQDQNGIMQTMRKDH